jgi:hypothetical protein
MYVHVHSVEDYQKTSVWKGTEVIDRFHKCTVKQQFDYLGCFHLKAMFQSKILLNNYTH